MLECSDDPIRFDGTITKVDGTPWTNKQVLIAKYTFDWAGLAWYYYPINSEATTDSSGFYQTGYAMFAREGHFGMFLKEDPSTPRGLEHLVEERVLVIADYDEDSPYINHWTYHGWDYEIPEFTTIAIPVASILGLLFFFDHHKRRKEQ